MIIIKKTGNNNTNKRKEKKRLNINLAISNYIKIISQL